MSEIINPVVLIHQNKTPEITYHIAITDGSTDFRDADHVAILGADYEDRIMNDWSKTGYYMAEEIQRLRQQLIAPLSIGELIQRLESQTGDHWGRVVNDVTTGKPLTITLPALPVLGSQDEWYQGFAAGAGSMREECAAVLISVGIGVEMKW